MKTINTFLIALFVTIFSVTSFSQTTHTFYVSDTPQDSTITISKNDTVKFFSSRNGNFDFRIIDKIEDIDNGMLIKFFVITDSITFFVKEGSVGGITLLKLTVNINTLGVNDLSNINFNIFPNPTTDFLNISGAQIEALQVFDVNGRLVLSETPSANSLSLDVRSLETGFYTVLVNNQQTLRFIKE